MLPVRVSEVFVPIVAVPAPSVIVRLDDAGVPSCVIPALLMLTAEPLPRLDALPLSASVANATVPLLTVVAPV